MVRGTAAGVYWERETSELGGGAYSRGGGLDRTSRARERSCECPWNACSIAAPLGVLQRTEDSICRAPPFAPAPAPPPPPVFDALAGFLGPLELEAEKMLHTTRAAVLAIETPPIISGEPRITCTRSIAPGLGFRV